MEKMKTGGKSMKPLKELNLMDRFLFAQTMEKKENLQLVLSIILGRELELKEKGQTEKELRTVPWLRSVRLDVAGRDESGVYNAEVQKRNTGNLKRRSRFYQSLIDSSLLEPGDIDFNSMADSTTIMITPFDLFGKEKYQYVFRMRCEDEELWLEDGAVRIFLNTRGRDKNGVRQEVIELLRYFENSTEQTARTCRSPRVQALHQEVERIKAAEEIGVKYMQEWEEKIYIREEGRNEGRNEGLIEGRSEGLIEGRNKGLIEGEKNLLKKIIAKKLEKGNDARQIAAELEEQLPVIETLIGELAQEKAGMCEK